MNTKPKRADEKLEDAIVLDRSSSEPLYQQLEQALLLKITAGIWPQGFQLPTHRRLAELTGVSLITVQQAVDKLVNRNVLYRRQGHGTFVANHAMKPASNRIGLFLPNLREPFFSVLAQIIQTEMINDGYALSVFALDDGLQSISRAVDIMLDQHVDGVITTPANNAEAFAKVCEMQARGIPFVLVDGHLQDAEISYVECDNRTGMEMIVDHLIGLGHRRIAFASGPCYTYGLKARMEAFSELMEARDVDFNPSYLQISHLDRDEGGWDAAHKLLLLRNPPTAIACSSDMVAAGVLRAAKALGIAVPDQLSVAGFDDLYLAAHLEVPLTTVHQPVEEIGRVARRLLIERIQNPTDGLFESHLVAPNLTMRCSTAPVEAALMAQA